MDSSEIEPYPENLDTIVVNASRGIQSNVSFIFHKKNYDLLKKNNGKVIICLNGDGTQDEPAERLSKYLDSYGIKNETISGDFNVYDHDKQVDFYQKILDQNNTDDNVSFFCAGGSKAMGISMFKVSLFNSIPLTNLGLTDQQIWHHHGTKGLVKSEENIDSVLDPKNALDYLDLWGLEASPNEKKVIYNENDIKYLESFVEDKVAFEKQLMIINGQSDIESDYDYEIKGGEWLNEYVQRQLSKHGVESALADVNYYKDGENLSDIDVLCTINNMPCIFECKSVKTEGVYKALTDTFRKFSLHFKKNYARRIIVLGSELDYTINKIKHNLESLPKTEYDSKKHLYSSKANKLKQQIKLLSNWQEESKSLNKGFIIFSFKDFMDENIDKTIETIKNYIFN